MKLTRLIGLLEHKRASSIIIVLSVTLILPSLWAGLIADDYIQGLHLKGDSEIGGSAHRSFDLFTFSSGEPGELVLLREEGVFSWWTVEGFKLSFWRPLSCATHILDHRWLGGHPVLMHGHSILWLILLLMVVSRIYRDVSSGAVAGLALLLYAVDDAKGLTVGFVANRNALIAGVFAFASLLTHLKARREPSFLGSVGTWISPVLLGLGLLAGESAFAVTAYLFAYAIFLDKGSYAKRLVSILPHGLVCGLWLGFYQHAGYGTYGSGVYLNPFSEPWAYLTGAAQRLPILLLGQVGAPTADLWIVYPPAVACGVFAFAIFFLAILFLLLRDHIRHDPVCRFWVLGWVLSCLPFCATFPSDRLFIFPGVGAMGVLATLMGKRLAGKDGQTDRRAVGQTSGERGMWERVAVGFLVFLHLVVAPLTLPLRSLSVRGLAMVFDMADRGIPEDPSIREKTLVILYAPSDGLVCYIPYTRQAQGRPRPGRIRLLSTTTGDIEVTRLNDHSLLVRADKGFLASTLERMLRGLSYPMKPGDQVEVSDLTVEIVEVTEDGMPWTVEFRFAAPLEDERWLWRRWEGGRLIPWTPPPAGEKVTIAGPDLGTIMASTGE